MSGELQRLLAELRELEARLPPGPWEADVDDGDTFTGKFHHPHDGQRTATALYDDAGLACDLAELRNLAGQLLRAGDAETPALKSGELPACGVELLPAEHRVDNEPGLFVRPGIDVRYPEGSERVSSVHVKLSADRTRGVVVLHLAKPTPPATASCLAIPVEVRP